MPDGDWNEQEPGDVRALEDAGAEFDDVTGAFPDLDEFDAADQEPPLDALDEIEALAAAESAQLEEAHAALAQERARTQAAIERYREAVLAAEPDLPPELVRGATLETLDASIDMARRTVADVRARLTEAAAGPDAPPARGFPIGAPARTAPSRAGLSAAEKIRRGLEERTRA